MSRIARCWIAALLLCVALPPSHEVFAVDQPTGAPDPSADFTVEAIYAVYSGAGSHLIESEVARPLSLASADLDEDGIADLIVGYGDGASGAVVVHRGNLEAIYPGAGDQAGPPFVTEAEVFQTAHRPDHIAAGDFDADGHVDVVTAMMGGSTLALRRGTGDGRFAVAELVELGGRVTALASGEVNRRDGLTDIVVGVDRSDGPAMLVFEHPLGALSGAPEVIETPEVVATIELGDLDDDWLLDISADGASSRVEVAGRDRRLSLGRAQRRAVPPPTVLVEPLPASTRKTTRTPNRDAAPVDGEILAALEMRLNRDALPDVVVILADAPAPLVVTTLARATFTVDSTADDSDFSTADGVCDTDDSVGDGPCTLRAAIEQANASPGADAVDFDIPGPGPHTINPVGSYLEILYGEPLTIDGYTQPGAAFNTHPPGQGTNAVIMIEIVGGDPNVYNGISVRAEGSVVRGLAINRIEGTGIGWFTENGSIVEGNFIGTDPSGTVAHGNVGTGVFMGSGGGHLLGGTAPAARNIISASGGPGVYIQGTASNGNQVVGNLIGTDATGELDFGNADEAIHLLRSDGNTIGGAAPGARNLISGNGGHAIFLEQNSCDDTVIQGNFIGSNAAGDSAIGCDSYAVLATSYNVNTLIGGTAGTTPGGGCTGACNLMVGCSLGPSLTSAENATIQGNFIGVDASGTSPLGNTYNGITLSHTLNAVVGGSVAAARNIISGNGFDGIKVNHGSYGVNTTIQGNFIGTDATGMAAIPNGDGSDYRSGIYIEHSNDVFVGGAAPGEGNLISGNDGHGIRIYGSQAAQSTFQGNLIGVDASGTGPLPNTFDGIHLEYVAANNLIGGSLPGEANTIAFNGGGGIVTEVDTGTSNTISGNSIFGNTDLGIDLQGDGVTANDPDDPDSGPNDLQNFPEITAVSGATITGVLDSIPDTGFDLEFFSSDSCDPSTHGEGGLFLGAGTALTDASGDAAFVIDVATPPPPDSSVTATATDPNGNTSEFSQCHHHVVDADLVVTKDDGVTTAIPGGSLTYTIVAGNSGPDTVAGARVTDAFPAELSCTWSCVAAGSATCTAGPVAGDIDDTVILPMDGTASYTAICDVAPSASGTISNTATVTAPAGATDPNPGNNSATDVDAVLELDLGDAPDPSYPTLHATNGARHVLGGPLFLGGTVDGETDGQPTVGADGDDLDGSDDEDGIVFTTGIGAGLDASLDVTASGPGLLNAWADFNADGDWADAGEQIFTDRPMVAGVNSLSFPVPLDATVGTTYARFRLSSTPGIGPSGAAADGEVEDFAVEILSGPDLAMDMAGSSGWVGSGGSFTYTATITNNGPLTATSVTFADTLPDEVTFVSSSPGSPDCVFSVDTLTCDLGTLAPLGTVQVSIDVVLDHPLWGSLSNTGTVTAAQVDPITTNNSAAVDTLIGLFFDGFESGDHNAWFSVYP